MRPIDADNVLKALGIFNDREHGDPHFLNGIETAREIVEQAPTVDAAPVRHGTWDLCITAKGLDLWTADAVCRNCGFTKPKIWSGFFPLVPPDIARDTTRRHSERVKLPNYCENCGAKMDGDGDA